MFKNIQISEINRKPVFKSVWILLVAYIVGVSIMAFLKGESYLPLYIFIQFVFFGWVFWIPGLLVIHSIEYFVLNKQASEKRARNLLIGEVAVIFLLVLVGIINNGEFAGMALLCTVVFGQYLRWVYLKSSGKLYTRINLKPRSNENK